MIKSRVKLKIISDRLQKKKSILINIVRFLYCVLTILNKNTIMYDRIIITCVLKIPVEYNQKGRMSTKA